MKKADSAIFFIATTLISLGIVFSLSLSAFVVLLYNYDHLHFFIRQGLVGVFSIFLMWIMSKFNPDFFLTKFCMFLFFGMLILMAIMPFFPSQIVREVNGAARWIRLPFISLAPVEFFKIGFIYFLAWSFNRKIDRDKKPFLNEIGILLPYFFLFAGVAYVITILQNDLGQFFVLSMVLVTMIGLAGTSIRTLAFGFLLVMVSVFLFITTSEHRISRLSSWWAGIQDVLLSFFPAEMASKFYVEGVDAPYQISHSLNAINNGGFLGQGIGFGTFKLGFLSEVHTDFVLAGMSEEIGFLGLLFVVTLFSILLFRIFKVSLNSQNNVYYLFSAGIGLMILFSFMVNSYAITSIVPVKGLAVPFLSYGGSQLLASSIAIGCVLMISKKAKNEK